MEAAWPLAVGGRLVIDGETVFVNAVGGAEVHGFTAAGAPVRFVLTRVAGEERAVANGEELRFGSVLLDAGALSAAQLREAADLLGHRNEAWFGYRSGDPLRPSEGEPQAGFDPAQTTVADRLEQKATELGCSVAKLFKKRRELVRRGLVALMDGRAARHAAGPAGDAVLRAAIVAEAQELADASDVRKMQFRARVASRLSRESGEPLELPCSRQTLSGSSMRFSDRPGCSGCLRRAAGTRRARRARIWGRWWRSGRASTSRSTPPPWTCSRSTRSRSTRVLAFAMAVLYAQRATASFVGLGGIVRLSHTAAARGRR